MTLLPFPLSHPAHDAGCDCQDCMYPLERVRAAFALMTLGAVVTVAAVAILILPLV